MNMLDTQIDTDDRKIASIIADLGAASEVDIQVRTLQPLKELRQEIGRMERQGLIRRRHNAFKGGYGDALLLTEQGYKSIG